MKPIDILAAIIEEMDEGKLLSKVDPDGNGESWSSLFDTEIISSEDAILTEFDSGRRFVLSVREGDDGGQKSA